MTAQPEADREAVLGALAEVIEWQARVVRAEAVLSTSRRRLDESTERLAHIARDRAGDVPMPSLLAAALASAREAGATAHASAPHLGTLRERIVAAMEASPGEVFTPARLSPLVGSDNRNSIRNTLLVLAAKGSIDKVGFGQYQARKPDGGSS